MNRALRLGDFLGRPCGNQIPLHPRLHQRALRIDDLVGLPPGSGGGGFDGGCYSGRSDGGRRDWRQGNILRRRCVTGGLLCGGGPRRWLCTICLICRIVTGEVDALLSGSRLLARIRGRRFQRGANADNQQHKHQNAQSHHDVLAGGRFLRGRFFTFTRATLYWLFVH